MPEAPNTDRWTPERRSALVLRIIKGETTADEASRTHGLSASHIHEWQRRFLQGGERALRRAPGRRRFRVSVLLIVTLWLLLRAAYFNGYYVEDAPGYVTDAIYFALGDVRARDYVTGLNVGTYLPVALPLRLFGKAELALALWPLFSSLLGLVSIIGIARILFGRSFGLLAGMLYATYPGDVFFSTVVMPDAIQAGWLTLSIFLVVCAWSGSAGRAHLTLAAAGAAMGFCHLIRANGPILLPIGVIAATVLPRMWKGQTWRSALVSGLAYLTGWLAIQVLEGVVYFRATGDFLHRFHVVEKHYGALSAIAQWGLNTDPRTIPFSIFPPLLWLFTGEWGEINHDQAYHGFIFVLALTVMAVAGVLALRVKGLVGPAGRAGLLLAAAWFSWPLLYHQFGSQSLTAFVPMHRLSRHLVVYAPGAIFATAAGAFVIGRFAAKWRAQAVRPILAVLALGVLSGHLYFNWRAEQVAFRSFHQIKGTYQRIRYSLPPRVRMIAGDPGDLGFFDFWLNPLGFERVRLVPFSNFASCNQIVNGVVLTYSNPGWYGLAAPVIRETVARLPCLVTPPPDWRLLYDGFPEKVYVVQPAHDAR